MNWISQIEVLAEVALAMILGGIIGIERQITGRPAGFRTQMLVAGAAAMLVGLANALVANSSLQGGQLRADPIRIVEAIITGVSFLGAGTIFRRGDRDAVHGITTAASLLMSAGIGVAVALRQFVIGVGVVLLTVIVLHALSKVDAFLERKKGRQAGSMTG